MFIEKSEKESDEENHWSLSCPWHGSDERMEEGLDRIMGKKIDSRVNYFTKIKL